MEAILPVELRVLQFRKCHTNMAHWELTIALEPMSGCDPMTSKAALYIGNEREWWHREGKSLTPVTDPLMRAYLQAAIRNLPGFPYRSKLRLAALDGELVS